MGDTAAATLSMLEERLRKIDYIVNGDQDNSDEDESKPTISASTRLRNLERTMKTLAARSHAVSDILQLHKQYPELFHATDAQTVPTTLPPASLAQLVLAHEKLYRNTSTQLTTLNENSSIPESGPLVKLIAMQSRIDRLETKQQQQSKEFAELRARSARVVEHWYEDGVLDMGDKWATWEERLREAEILVRRNEARKRREEAET